MKEFQDIFDEKVVEYLKKNNISSPTTIQQEAIPALLENKNIFFSSHTGSGKTYTYLLPMIKTYDVNIKTPQAIVIAPTQDLAIQIFNVAKDLFKSLNLPEPILACGGTSLNRQIEGLKTKPSLVIGTTTRILQLNDMKKLKLHTVKTIVFDECDKMLDKLNIDETKSLIKKCLRDTSLVFTSASVGNDTLENIKTLRENVELIEVSKNNVPTSIEHYFLVCDTRKKVDLLRKAFHAFKADRALVFINKDVEITSLSAKFEYNNLEATFIDGELKGFERKKALQDFKTSKVKLLVASDLASRGLDIKNLTYVFNFSAPHTYEQYLHRCGRCGRNNTKGIVLTICDTRELSLIKKYESKLNIDIKEINLHGGEVIVK
ncbi:MAG: DEAD/DEAH box helicase [Lachnospirales bacterium]